MMSWILLWALILGLGFSFGILGHVVRNVLKWGERGPS